MKKLYVLSLLVFSNIYGNILLQEPKRLSSLEVEELAKKWEISCSWRLGIGRDFSCFYAHGQSSILVQLFGIPIRSYNLSYVNLIKKTFNAYTSEDTPPYYYAKPRIFDDPSPQEMSSKELSAFLKDKRFIVYTGAGISALGGVPTMCDLMDSLTLTSGRKAFLTELFFHPENQAAAFSRFCKAAIYAKPTPAHEAVYALCSRRPCALLTENLDLLHQRAGSEPLFTKSKQLHDVQAKDLQEVDCILCAGLSYDDSGFLAYYKEQNPQGSIIAINTAVPSYLDQSDYLITQDLQVVLPALEAALRY